MFSLRPVAMGIMTVALLVLATSISTDEWYSVTTVAKRKFNGLWNHCVQMSGRDTSCNFLRGWEPISDDTMTAIRGFFALAILFQLGAIIYPPFYKQMASGIVKLEFMAILCLIATCFAFLGMIIITHEVIHHNEGPTFGWSYYLGWAGTGVSAVGAALGAISTRDDVYMDQGM
ncbi:uncharacterized protein LOC135688576 [Rhopilema esculentum]|uniref:uncharacterized protein LOC135688576 n=1 Tax=Rhopilema esculentum TaxID=499914 RepID=UPI0031D722EA